MSVELRPTTLKDVIGQEKVVERLSISINAAKQDGRPLSHVLIDGFPGLGKTTLAKAIANEMGAKLLIANGGNLKSIKSVLPYVGKIEEGWVWFIDEIHRVPDKVAEFLYPVIEEFRADVGDEQFSVDVPKFTCIGATTKVGALDKPLVDRFPLQFQLSLYDVKTLEKIIIKNMSTFGLQIEPAAAQSLARRARGTPRISNGHVCWVRDYVTSKNIKVVTTAIVNEAMGMMQVDENGMTPNDLAYLAALSKDEPKSLKSIADTIAVDMETIENVIEPFLLRLNKIEKTGRGRILK